MNSIKRLLGVLMFLGTFVAFSSCSDDDNENAAGKYKISYSSVKAIGEDALSYISSRYSKINETDFINLIEQKKAEDIFKSFCNSISNEVKEKNFKVYSDAYLVFKLDNLTTGKSKEERVTFTQTATVKYSIKVDLEEDTPQGDIDKAKAYIESKLLMEDVVTSSEPADNNYTINWYKLYKEFDTYEESEAYYKNDKVSKMLRIIESDWPSDIRYTGKFTFYHEGAGSSGHYSAIIQNPILHDAIWKTNSTMAPFTTMNLERSTFNKERPYFMDYKTSLDGVASDFISYMVGYKIFVKDGANTKYVFETIDGSTIKLLSIDEVNITYEAIYTKSVE